MWSTSQEFHYKEVGSMPPLKMIVIEKHSSLLCQSFSDAKFTQPEFIHMCGCHNTQHQDTRHNDIQHNNTQHYDLQHNCTTVQKMRH